MSAYVCSWSVRSPTTTTTATQIGNGYGMLGFQAAVADRFIEDAAHQLECKCVASHTTLARPTLILTCLPACLPVPGCANALMLGSYRVITGERKLLLRTRKQCDALTPHGQ